MFFGAATIAVGCLLLFNPIWTTVRFSRLFGEFHSMQLAYDEPVRSKNRNGRETNELGGVG